MGAMSGKAPKDKGSRFERELVNAFRAAGIDAYRIPLSGAQSGFNGDVVLRLPTGEVKIEAKCRRRGFSQFYQWLEGVKYLAFKQDRRQPIIAMSLDTFLALLSPPVQQQSSTESLPSSLLINGECKPFKDTASLVKVLSGKPSVRVEGNGG